MSIDLNLAAIQLLESLQAAGVVQLQRPAENAARLAVEQPATAPTSESTTPEPSSAAAAPAAKPSIATPQSVPIAQPPEKQPEAPSAEAASSEKISEAATLEILRQEVAGCTLCGELAATRTQTVFGSGDPKARLCLLGEAPGADEDARGEPFVGASGQLLNKILGACKLEREDVYILNILKCRPPGNRNPAPEESQNCRQYLIRQLQLIEPEFICCLGAVASQNLLDTTSSLGRLRGQLHDYRGIKVLCTYHPAYLLRNPAAKKDCWDDMKFLMREMGAPVD